MYTEFSLLFILLFYPYALSIGASDLDRGQVYTVTISAPEGSAVSVQAPAWISVTPLEYVGGDTFKAVLHVAGDAPDAYGRIILLVDGIGVASQGVRVGEVKTTLIYLPIISASP